MKLTRGKPPGPMKRTLLCGAARAACVRVLKVGKVRLHFEPNPIATGKAFRQELKLREGRIGIAAGDAGEAQARLWVDAAHPVIKGVYRVEKNSRCASGRRRGVPTLQS